jgi:hypothetical protein
VINYVCLTAVCDRRGPSCRKKKKDGEKRIGHDVSIFDCLNTEGSGGRRAIRYGSRIGSEVNSVNETSSVAKSVSSRLMLVMQEMGDGSGICDKKLHNMKWRIDNAASELKGVLNRDSSSW